MYKILLIVCALLIGCTHTQQITNKKVTKEDMYVKFNQYAQKREGEIKLTDGVLRKGKSFIVESDSIRFIDKLRSQELTLPIASVEYVDFTSYVRGMAEGALIGTLSGFALGFLSGLLSTSSCGEMDEGCVEPGFIAVVYGVLFSGVGLLSGSVVGGSQGSKVIFVFNKSTKMKESK